MGIIMMALYLGSLAGEKGWFSRDLFRITTCKGLILKIEKKIPGNWKLECEVKEQNLFIRIATSITARDRNQLRKKLYRSLANKITKVARISSVEKLEKIPIVRFSLEHKEIKINAIIEGEMLARLSSLKTPQQIKDHLAATVKIQEYEK